MSDNPTLAPMARALRADARTDPFAEVVKQRDYWRDRAHDAEGEAELVLDRLARAQFNAWFFAVLAVLAFIAGVLT